jgi:tetratricopeptide (TPR) repeat protein
MSYARSDQRAAARSDLVRCIENAEDQDIQWRAYTVLGTLDFEDRQWARAARSYAAAARTAPKKPPTGILLYRLGLCLERCGRWKAAREPYERIVSEFPTGGAGHDARRRLQINADYFAVQCGVFASLKNAQNLVTDLERQGLRARIRREPRNDVLMHVVLVGQYTDYDQALHELARIKGYIPNAVLWP